MSQLLSLRRAQLLFALFIIPALTFSQSTKEENRQRVLSDPKVESVTISENRHTPSFISFRSDAPASRAQVKTSMENYLGIRPGLDEARSDKETKTADKEVVEFQQFFKGVKVDRAKFKAYLNKGQLQFMNGAWYDVPTTLSVIPTLSKEAALVFAKGVVNANYYVTDDKSPGGELVIVKDFNNAYIDKESKDEVRLAWKFNIYTAEPLSRSWVYVDANTGKILLVDAIIKHVNENTPPSVPVQVQTRYAGTRSINVKQISGNDPHSGLPIIASNPLELYVPGSPTWALIDDTRGNGIETYDLNGVGGLPLNIEALYLQGKSFTDVDNNWTLAEHKRGGAAENENDDFAWDAHWGAGVVYDYWAAKHGRLSFDGNNGKIKSFIHSGLAFDNAFWNGSVMTYGDGTGTAANGFKPLTSLDVCAHEIGHGVCEFTSNLVYAMESGAMNEGFSDIWGACMEYFAIKTIDPSLNAAYKPFYIGEQISANPAAPLRRMDNPKAATDPDTYGGQYWKTQDCSPTLANDQCGVHANSGVLNKWFYLITVGSGTGSGPDAAYAGEDDGVNDLTNPYQVTGLGFDISEKIAYLTELMLTTTATYAEAREVSIAVATDYSGNPCSALVESVTNAWYAVGVGAQFVKPCTITYGFVMQGAGVTESTEANGCAATKTFNIPVVLPPNSTATATVSGTAGTLDYSLSAATLSNSTAQNARQNIIVTIKNDGVVEGDEYLQLTIAITNTAGNPVNTGYRLTILDDDAIPVIGSGQSTLLNETFTRADGFADPAGWTEILEIPEAAVGDPTGNGMNQWGIFDNKLAITGREGATGTQLPNGMYNSNSNSQTLIKSPLLDARGFSVVNLKFDYTVQGELDPNGAVEDPENLPVFDYMAVAYSTDGVNFTELNTGTFRQFASIAPASGTVSGTLPASLANKQFYIAFRWFNDTNAGGPYSCSVDNLTVTAAPRTIEGQSGHGSRENLAPQQQVYFYSTQDGEVVTRISNTSTKDLGCTNTFVERAGNGGFNLYQNNQGLHKVSDKVIRIETGISPKATSTVTLYFTEAQLEGLEAATGRSRTTFSVYQVQGISYAAATNNNTKRYTPVYTSIAGVGGYYTVSFNDRANGSWTIGTIVSLFAKAGNTIAPEETIVADWIFGPVSPNPAQSTSMISIHAPSQQRIKMEIVNELRQHVVVRSITVQHGRSQLEIPAAQLRRGKYIVTLIDENGRILNSQAFIKQ